MLYNPGRECPPPALCAWLTFGNAGVFVAPEAIFGCAISNAGSVLKNKFNLMEALMCFSSLNYPENDRWSIDRWWWISWAAFSVSLTACPPARVSRDRRWAISAANKVCTVKSRTNAHSYQSLNGIKKILVSSKTHPDLFCNEKVPCGWNWRC